MTLILALGLTSLAGCGAESRSASGQEVSLEATASSTEFPSAVPSQLSPTEEGVVTAQQPLTLGPPPKVPRASARVRGHVVTVEFLPGTKSAPVSEYNVRVTRPGAPASSGRLIDSCAAQGQESTPCTLKALPRGTWDVWVRALGKNGDSGWSLSAPVVIDSCTTADARAGNCEVFDKGPGGGTIFYAAPWREDWGQYLEAAPPGWTGSPNDPAAPLCTSAAAWDKVKIRQGIGYGQSNTINIMTECGNASAAAIAYNYRGGEFSDWFLPSAAELRLMYNMRTEVGGLTNSNGDRRHDYWASDKYVPDYSDQYNQGKSVGRTLRMTDGDSKVTMVDFNCGIRPIRRA